MQVRSCEVNKCYPGSGNAIYHAVDVEPEAQVTVLKSKRFPLPAISLTSRARWLRLRQCNTRAKCLRAPAEKINGMFAARPKEDLLG